MAETIAAAPLLQNGRRRLYISRCINAPDKWVLRRVARFDQVTNETCLDVSHYRRNFAILG